MRAAAEVDEFAGGVEGDHRVVGLFLHQLAFEFLIRFAIEIERLGLGNQLAFVGNVFRGQLAHLDLDLFEVFRRERLVAQKFVEEPGIDRRANAELHVRIQFKHRGGQKVRGRVPENLHGVGIFRGENRELNGVVERARKIDQIAVRACDESFLGEAR